MAVNENDLALVAQALHAGRMSEADMAAMLGNQPERLRAVTDELQRRVLAKRIHTPHLNGIHWAIAAPIIARCAWTPERVLEQIAAKPCTGSELATRAKCAPEPMRLLLRRMQYEKLVKTKAVGGVRCWIPYGQYVPNGGERKPVRNDKLLRLIRKHQPVRLELLAELTGRGRVYLRERVHKLRRKGKVNILGVDGSWLYVLPDYERSPEDIGRDILLRCKDVGGDCLKWDGARNRQGHPLVRHGGNTLRVDIVLWTAVHGRALKPGHTLVRTCETPGCCNHAHHEQVTRGEAMRRAFAALGIGGEAHGRKVAQAVRSKIGIFTPEQVELIRSSTKSDSALAKELNCCKSTVGSARRHETYRDYGTAFRGLGARA